ncbi:AMP-binding protein [Gordonia amarae]|uniref:AMP-binding protein n=2 Tax=Gordonia amarae TaxID=36821 RepID=A0A857L1F4_9ACTN|nr:class I adenylate-forming enzyme family protein [Gordonia amarae]MCS3880805.1 acyl-CoA synthetase (AMP-forming)/AMP-acid ligase II [Gordonia amarae]QHN19083.1 AMP-binding protein [Gordonia amarae]QHN23558.1 AMP-binding protein [Gordonia amarae]QHN32458.1 AMP-binding protein [Gordonia amarae]QHN41207.1 AMP-binding protein [Gordonia amarae]
MTIFEGGFADDPRLADLFAEGGPFEITETIVDGSPVRTYLRCPRTLADIFARSAAHGDLVSMVYRDQRLTFADIRAQALALARTFRADYGVAPGDRVMIAMRNRPEFTVAFWAAVTCGAIAVPVNAWWQGPELAAAVAESEPKVIIADPERITRFRESGCAVPVIGVGEAYGETCYEDCAFGEQLPVDDIVARKPDDPAAILYTSGTTGRPKGVVITHRGVTHNVMNMALMMRRGMLIASSAPAVQQRQSAGLLGTHLFHIGGIAAIVNSALTGAKIVMLHKWDVDDVLRLGKEEQVTGLGGVPTMVRKMLAHPDIGDFAGKVLSFQMGAASVPPDIALKAREVLGDNLLIFNGYGATETTSAMATNVGDEYASHPSSVGKLNPTAELRIVAEGRDLGPNELGELWFRSPQIARGYWNNPEATAESFVDGWWRTGDVGYIDDDGFIYVVDRIKDIIIRGGENVYCVEVESVLFEHSDIVDVAVVAVPDEMLGEKVCAVVIPAPGCEPTLDALRRFATDRLAYFKLPELLVLTDDVPRTATGKIAKRRLRDQLGTDLSAAIRP